MKYPLQDEKEATPSIELWHIALLIIFILIFAFFYIFLVNRAFYMGLYEQKKGNMQRAISIYRFSLLLNPYSAKALRNLCSAEIDIGCYSQAVKHCSEGLKLRSNNLNVTRTGNIDSDLLNNRGLAFMHLGRFEAALSDFNRALKIDPKHLNAYSNRGCLKTIQGNAEEGLNDFQKVVEIDPEYELVEIYKEECKPNLILSAEKL